MNVKFVASVLLIGRIIALYLMIRVIIVETRLMKKPIYPPDEQAESFRKRLYIWSFVVAAGNILPIILDVTSIIKYGQATVSGTDILVLYALSNSLTAAASAFLIWGIYKQAKE